MLFRLPNEKQSAFNNLLSHADSERYGLLNENEASNMHFMYETRFGKKRILE